MQSYAWAFIAVVVVSAAATVSTSEVQDDAEMINSAADELSLLLPSGFKRDQKRSVNFTPSWGKRSMGAAAAAKRANFACQEAKQELIDDLLEKIRVSLYSAKPNQEEGKKSI